MRADRAHEGGPRCTLAAQVADLPAELVKDLLQDLAKLRPNAGWELRLPADSDFLERYPEVVARQRAVLDERHKA